MFWADTIGVNRVLSGLERHRKALGPDFRISPLLKTIAEDGRRFNA
jgi:3-hydroxyacyl-CoA dehydrogenase